MIDNLPRFIKRQSVLGRGLRSLIRRARLFSLPLEFLIRFDAFERAAYAYCIFYAADLARRLGHRRISVLELGVAGGNGLVAAENIAILVEKHFGVTIELYGFDRGGGLPSPRSIYDLPYWFQESQYVMDENALRGRLKRAQLLLGDIKDTSRLFLEQDHAPIGAIMWDLDLYSSTIDGLKILTSNEPRKYLPRIFMYFDDVVGSHLEQYCRYTGELLAIDEFNNEHTKVKIARNENLVATGDCCYARSIFYAHLFSHPQYPSFVFGDEQKEMQQKTQLPTPV
jgi:hypothetical protein